MVEQLFNEDEMKELIQKADKQSIQKTVVFKPYEINENFLFPPTIDEYISKTHIARLISMVVDKMDITFILETYKGGGTSSYQPRMLLKVWLLGFFYRIYTSRRLETAVVENLPFIWISGSQYPDFRTLNNFRQRLKGEIKKIFKQVVELGMQLGLITGKDVFIDHTKIEANANRHKITWKKNVERELGKIEKELDILFEYIDKLNDEEDKKYGESGIKESQVNSLDPVKIEEMIKKLNDEIKKKTDKNLKKEMSKAKTRICELNMRRTKYNMKKSILGNRNSYSNTDPDATSMMQKDGKIIKPSYNEGIAVENQFVIDYNLSQSSADNVSFQNIVDGVIETLGKKPENVHADAAYGNEENSEYLEKQDINNYLKFQNYQKEKSKKWHSEKVRKEDFRYTQDDDYYTCPNGINLYFEEEREVVSTTGFKSKSRVYKAESGKCENCPYKKYCTESEARTIHINENYERYKKKVRENLASEKGCELRSRRSNEVESPFGDRKFNQRKGRFVLREKEKVNIESGLYWTTHNIRKIYKYMLENWLNYLNTGKFIQISAN